MIINVLDDIGYVRLVTKTQDPLLQVVNAARVSYQKYSETLTEKDINLIKFLFEHNHTSPFRHSFYTFEIKCPLFVFRQWIKYQVGCKWTALEINENDASLYNLYYDTENGCSWNEVSARYSILNDEFYVPSKFRGNSGHNKQQSSDLNWDKEKTNQWIQKYKDNNSECYSMYKEAIEAGIAKELARTLLPTSIYTSAYWSVSLQGLIHFLNQRLQETAQFEIRSFAQSIFELVREDLVFCFNFLNQ